jgi:flagellar hook-associated protein 1 FlgK
MAGLFDTLALGSRSLSTYRKAIDTTGHNLANVNTEGYTRQRVVIEATTTSGGTEGPIGNGSEVVKIVQLQSATTAKQLQTEASIEGSLSVKQDALQQALVFLQEKIDRNGGDGTSTQGISQGLADFFATAQSVATSPASLPDRQVFLQKAQELATKFNNVDARLGSLQEGLDERVSSEVGQVNGLLQEIAGLNQAIVSEEALSSGYANDLRDSRQVKLEALSRLVKTDVAEQENGAVNVAVGGNLLVEGTEVANRLETFSDADGTLQVRVAGQSAALSLTSGSIQGAIAVRDGEIAALRGGIDLLANTLITQVNAAHSTGFGLNGTTGAPFFTGTGAGDIAVNATLLRDPSLFQAAGVAGEAGNNTVARAIADLQNSAHATLGGLTFSNKQAQTVAVFGQEVATAKSELADQKTISQFVRNQRDSISGVSVDEEMTNLIMFQKAFQASARLISMTDEMLATIIEM